MSCKQKIIAKVAVEKAAFSFDREFDYLVPERLSEEIACGKRVLVPFGRGNSRRQGIVTELVEREEAEDNLKEVISVLDSSPVASAQLIGVARFMKEHYFCTLYDAVKTMLPAGVNYKVTTVYGVRAGAEEIPLSGEEQRLVDWLKKKRGAVRLETILDAFGLAGCVIRLVLSATSCFWRGRVSVPSDRSRICSSSTSALRERWRRGSERPDCQ